ncbi:MAG: aldo/keto reductase [Armatimonadota bacterium]
MNYRDLGRTGLKVSELGLGGLEIGRPWGIRSADDSGQPPPEEEVTRFLNHLLDQGVNLIDTAAAYWASEERIGKSLKHRRDDYILCSKWGEWCDESGSVYDYSAKEFWKFLESGLTKLQTDVIDVYQIHSARMNVLEDAEAISAMKAARDQGKIRFLGLSCGPDEAVAAMRQGDFDVIQISYSLLDLHMEQQVLPLARDKNVGVLIKDGLASGRLTSKIDRVGDDQSDLKAKVAGLAELASSWGMSLPEMSLRFVLSNPAVSSVIAGTRSATHLGENMRAADGQGLTDDQISLVRTRL